MGIKDPGRVFGVELEHARKTRVHRLVESARGSSFVMISRPVRLPRPDCERFRIELQAVNCLATAEVNRVVAGRQVDDHIRLENGYQVHDARNVLDPSRGRTVAQRFETDELIEGIEWCSTHVGLGPSGQSQTN